MKVIWLFVVLFVLTVVIGVGIGSFLDWLGEKRAKAEIAKHDAEQRYKYLKHKSCVG